MKIIYLHQYFKFPNEYGSTRSFDLATGFVNLGNHVEIIASTSDKKYKTKNRWMKVNLNGLKIHYIYLPYSNHMTYFTRSIVFFKFFWFGIFKLLSLNADIVIASSTPLTIGIPALIKKFLHKTPYIFEVRDVWPEAAISIGAMNNKVLQKFLFFLEYIIYKYAELLVPLSVDMKKSIISRYPEFSQKPIKVIENICEINRFQNYQFKKKLLVNKKIGFKPRFTILYAGAFGRVNGLDYLIELASKLLFIDPSIVFLLIGNGIEKKKLIDKATLKCVLNKNIFFFDAIPKQDLPQLYYECDMGSSFVISKKPLWANSANKFFDTLASGRPVLINYEGWQKEIIEKENIGYVLPCVIDDHSIKKFIQYSESKLLCQKQKENALKIAKGKYSISLAIEKYNKILTNINVNVKQ